MGLAALGASFCFAAAAGGVRAQPTRLTRQAVGFLVRELEREVFRRGSERFDRKLRNPTGTVFEFNRQLIGWNDLFRKFEDTRQFTGGKTVGGVFLGHPRLQETGLGPTYGPAAVNELPNSVPNFRNVELKFDCLIIRKNESKVPIAVLRQRILEFGKLHAITGIFLYRYISSRNFITVRQALPFLRSRHRPFLDACLYHADVTDRRLCAGAASLAADRRSGGC